MCLVERSGLQEMLGISGPGLIVEILDFLETVGTEEYDQLESLGLLKTVEIL